MKRIVTTVAFLFITAALLFAAPFGLSLSTWSASPQVGSGEGIHGSIGVFVAPITRLEIEGALVASLTPRIGQDLLGSLFLSTGFAGPLYYRDGRATLYYNGLVGVGFIGGWDYLNNQMVGSIALRVTPFTIGGAYYTRRERALTVTALYDLFRKQWGVSFSLLGFDIYR